ncbi:integral membrane protein PTH11 [Fusarium beomiforme]|uniref:Integral membrane protein PTH11 n=1 Tax=Fusarium beomiforme TaxID=44412 RepID=A0A9P5AN51_9HYPO|nr:integral membrane protein PTH11 [Fusarium beomiforme]
MTAFEAEIWTWYSLSWLIVIARMISRRMLLGSFKKLQVEDYLMLVAMITDTVLMVGMSIISETSSNLIDPSEHVVLDAHEIKTREYGSKWVLVVEQMQITTIWLMKYCLLVMYNRLTMSLSQNLAVKFVAAYVTLGWLIMEILYLGVWCRPFNQYWAVPPNNTQCSAATNHLITNAVINITSDIMIILIPMPIFLKSQLPLKRKAVLVGVFALGSFTILSAILNKFYSFNEPFGSNWTFWYIRESSTAIITANLPYIWTLLRRIFKLGSFSGSTYGKGTSNPSKAYRSNFTNHRSVMRSQVHAEHNLHPVDSEEEINNTYALPLKIYAKHEIQITSEDAGPEDRRGPVGCIPDELMSNSKDSVRSDVETSSERSAAGVVKVYHGV